MSRSMRRLLSAVLVCLTLVACTKMPTWQEQYDLGVRYLSEGNYQEAIIAFTAAIEIDPKQENVYIALARTYAVQGDREKAEEVLAQAEKLLGQTEKLRLAREEFGLTVGSERIRRIDNPAGGYQAIAYDENGDADSWTLYDENDQIAAVREFDSDEQVYIGVYPEHDFLPHVVIEIDTAEQYAFFLVGMHPEKTMVSDSVVCKRTSPNLHMEYGWGYDEEKLNIDYLYIAEVDETGNSVQSSDYFYSDDGFLEYYEVYEYDDKGNRIRSTVTTYNSDGTVQSVDVR